MTVRTVKTWDELPPEVTAGGEVFSTRLLAKHYRDMQAENERLRRGLLDIKRNCGHVRINDDTGTLGLFVDQITKGTRA